MDSLTNKVLPERMIRIVEAPKDPLDPPNYHQHKMPAGFGDAAVPVMHSPPRKVTVQDMQDWKIPPCISNWKNARGLTIPLDKRLAADGRGLQQTVVNDKFAVFAEVMQAAESKAREELELRNSIVRKQKEKERQSQEELMRQRAAEILQQREDMEKAHDEQCGRRAGLRRRQWRWRSSAASAWRCTRWTRARSSTCAIRRTTSWTTTVAADASLTRRLAHQRAALLPGRREDRRGRRGPRD